MVRNMNRCNGWLAAALALCLLMTGVCSAGAKEEGALPEGVEIILSDGYEQGEPLPVYRAAQRTQQQDNFLTKCRPSGSIKAV